MRTGVLMIVAFAIAMVFTACSMSVAGHWSYIKDPHQPGPCLAWDDNSHHDRAGVYCRIYPYPVGTR